MGQTLHERFIFSLGHSVAVIVVNVMIDIDNRLLDVAHLVTEEIDGHHRIGRTFLFVLLHIVLAAVLCAKILAET